MAFRAWGTAVAVGAVVLAGCGSESSPPASTCPGPRPAFSLTVVARTGAPLPWQTRVKVKSGGGEETYDASAPTSSPQFVFCKPLDANGAAIDADAGDSVMLGSIACTLWTDGAADVTVDATGFVTAHQMFEAKDDSCGVVTSTVRVELDRVGLDGGT